MKGLRAPVGHLPAEVYWRRRVVLVVALAVTVALIWLVASAVSSDGAASEPAGTISPTAQPTAAAPAATVSPAAQADAQTGAQVPDATPDITACAQGDLDVALGGKPRVSAEAVRMEVTVTQVGDEPCLLDASAGKNALLVTSGDTRIWSSTDCPATAVLADKKWLLSAGSSKTFEVAWPREWSSEGCGSPSAVAPQPGTYWAQVTFQGLTPDAVAFVLS